MLRITIHESANGQTIQLEGKIVGPWVDEFKRSWDFLASSLGSKGLHLDLRGVAFVDAKGRQLLREIYQKTHADFLADSPLTQYFADDARQQFSRNGKEGV
jgi:anti-anti-sigma regulatory factor